MKLAISSFAWPRERTGDVARLLADMKVVSGVELVLPMTFEDPSRASVADAAAVKHFWKDHDLAVLSVQSLAFGRDELQLLGSAHSRAAFLDHLEQMAVLASALGAPRMVFGSPANRKRGAMSMSDALALAVPFFRTLAARIAPLGITCTIEPNPPIYAGCDFVTRTEEAVALVRAVEHPAIAVQLDTGAMLFANNEGPIGEAALDDALRLAGHLHVSLPGLASIDIQQDALAQCTRSLASAPVQVASIEMRAPADGSDPLLAIRRAVEAVVGWLPIQARA